MRFILTLALVVWPLRATAIDANELFDIDPSCSSQPIQQWVDEAGMLITAANNFYQAARTENTGGINRAARGYFRGIMNSDMPAAGVTNSRTDLADREPNFFTSA